MSGWVDANADYKIEISLIGDYEQIVTEDVCYVSSDRDYVQACSKLSQPIEQLEGSRIWVKNNSHYAWLRDFTAQIDLSCQFRRMTARMILADKWHVTLPEWLDDQTVLDYGLLNLSVAITNETTFSTRTLTHYLRRSL